MKAGLSKLIYVSSDNLKIYEKLKENTWAISQSIFKSFYIAFISDFQKSFFLHRFWDLEEAREGFLALRAYIGPRWVV